MGHGESYVYFFQYREILSNCVAVNAMVLYLGKNTVSKQNCLYNGSANLMPEW